MFALRWINFSQEDKLRDRLTGSQSEAPFFDSGELKAENLHDYNIFSYCTWERESENENLLIKYLLMKSINH